MYADKNTLSFKCTKETGRYPETWEGRLRIVKQGDPFEAEMEARGSYFHLIVGKHSYGNYICIPNWNVGTELSGLGDLFWNEERLRNYTSMKETDACSVAAALHALSACAGRLEVFPGKGAGGGGRR